MTRADDASSAFAERARAFMEELSLEFYQSLSRAQGHGRSQPLYETLPRDLQ